jgi:hypothetical protein
MFDPLFGGMLWTMVLCVIMPILVRLIKWRGIRYLFIAMLMLQVAIGISIMMSEPYTLEAITNRGGRSISNPNLVVNPLISWIFISSIVTAWTLFFTRPSDREVLWSNSTELLVTALLIAGGFYFWCFNSIKWMDHEIRDKIYYELGGYG